jgi:hypothetical protein
MAPAAFGPSSLASNSRPSTGRNPIAWKYDPPTTPTWTERGYPSPTSVDPRVEKSPRRPAAFVTVDQRTQQDAAHEG